MSIQILKYSDVAQACVAITGSITNKISGDLEFREEVTVLLSGGNSPKMILPILARSELDFSRITFLSSDERIVPPGHEDSTEGMVVNIFREEGISIKYIGLGGNTSSEEALAYWSNSVKQLDLPVSVALLGVGEDGHFSSFFPGRREITRRGSLAILVPETYPHKHNRLTLGLDFILRSELIVIPVFGKKKKAVVREAIRTNNSGNTPVSVLFSGNEIPVEIYEA